jgi:hypothetical protein
MRTAAQTPQAKETVEGTTLHVPISGELREKLAQMIATDRRQRTDFVRILIEDEWNRRQTAAAGNGAKP